MLVTLGALGSIEDLALDIRWDPATFAVEVTRRATVLSQLKVRRGSLVAIMHACGAHVLADLFAVWQLGATVACLDSTLTEEELGRILTMAKPQALLTDHELLADHAIAGVTSIPVVTIDALPVSAPQMPAVAPAPGDPALVLFTSGTTGEPKGVVLSYRALAARIHANIAAIGQANLARALVTLPLHFGHGLIGNALTPLCAGGDIVLHPPGLALAQDLSRIVDAHRISFMSSVPTLWRAATRHAQPAGTTLARVHVGSAPLPAELWSEIAAWSRADVVNCYGLTETANWVAGASSRNDGIAEGLIGHPWGCTVAIRRDDGTIRASGEGEILVKSPAVMDGYLGRPDLTAAVLKDGWFHTGDRGRVNDLGRIWLAGRIKEQINRAGFKIQPAEIDLLLERHPAIAEACVFGLPDRTSGEVVAAAIRLADGATASPHALQSWCLSHLRREAVPERWFIVDAIPRTGNGKVSRAAVRQSLVETESPQCNAGGALPLPVRGEGWGEGVTGLSIDLNPSPHPSPYGRGSRPRRVAPMAVRSAVEQAWRAVLGDIALARGLTWQVAGGDSINTLRLWFRLEEALGVCLPLDAMHPDAGIDDVVTAVEQAIAAQSLLPGHQPSDERPVVFFLPPAEGDLPMLAQFRAAFASRVRFVVIQYPDWRDMIRNGGGFDTMVDAAVAQIRAQSDANIVFLAGYSFGGIMAYEVARRLVAAGRRIGFLGLIDARYGGDAPRKRESALAKSARRLRRVTQPWRALEVLPKRLIAALSSIAAFRSLTAIGRMASALPPKILPPKLAFELNWHLTAHLRMKALRRWAVQPQDIPVVLFRSMDDWSLADYGWSNLSRQLSVVAIEGTHLSLFDPPYRDVLCARFFEMLEAAWSAVTLIA